MLNSGINRLKLHGGSILILLTAVFAVYGRTLGHEFLMTWDDRFYVVHNEAVKGFSWQHIQTVFSHYYVGNYAPVQMLSYMLDYELWGMKAGGFLLTNIVIHALNGLLLYRLLLKCHESALIAAIGAAVFLLHPVQVESVAWVSQRKNLLAMFFFLLAWEEYDRYRNAPAGKGTVAYMGSLAACMLALLAKSVAVIFPAVIMLYDFCYPTGNRRFRFLEKIPSIICAVCISVVTIHSQQPLDEVWGGGTGGGLADYHGGSAPATFLTMLTVYCRYLGMLIWPFKLSAVYEPAIHQSMDFTVVAAMLLLAGICLVTVRLLNSNRKTGFWILLFFVGLLPVSQIIPLVTLMNDRYLYFPMLGAAAVAGCLLSALKDKLGSRYKVHFYCVTALLLAFLSVVSFNRVAVWHDDISFGRATVARYPNQYIFWEGLGEAYYFAVPSRKGEALRAFNRALELAPTHKQSLYNLAGLYLEMGDYDKSADLLTRLVFYHQNHAMGWARLGDVYLQTGNYPEAEKCYKKALELKPDLQRAIEGLKNRAGTRGQPAP